jgi:hypothetical protein
VSVRYPDGIKPYLNDTNFKDRNFLSYMQSYVVDKMIDAANGLLVWWPVNVGDTNQRMGVEPIIVLPGDIKHYDTEVLTFLSPEKSLVEVEGQAKWEGDVYYIMLEEELWKRSESGVKGNNEYVWEIHAINVLGEVYALPLGGDEVVKWESLIKKEIRIFTSFFSSAIPFADECLCRHSDAQGTWISCASPIREIEPIDCMVCQQTGRVSEVIDGKARGMIACSSCGGAGHILPTSSYGYIVRPKAKGLDSLGNPQGTTKNAIEFLHPEPSILKFGEESWEGYLEKTKDALNLLFIKEAQSGIAKERDREDKLSSLDKIAHHFYYYLITQSVQIIHKIMFPNEDYPVVAINLPSSFIVKTEDELQEEIRNFRSTGVPSFLIGQKLRETTMKSFGGDPVTMKMFDVQVVLDPLFTYTLSEKNQMLATGAITERDWAISIYAYPMINKFQLQNDDFSEMEVDTIIAEVMPMIEEKIIEKQPEPNAFPRA